MPKIIPTEEQDAIAAVIRRHPDGIAANEIRAALPFPMSVRTMQRRLRLLEHEGRLTSRGAKKGKRYFPPTVVSPIERPAPTRFAEPETEFSRIPLSDAAREIRTVVRAPLVARTPVGYDQSFLASYVPNKTAYLPPTTRAELASLSQVEVSDVPAGTYFRQVLNRLLIDLSWNSSRLEGNTYSLLETERLLERGESADGKEVRETQMILNHKAAIEMLAEQADEIGFNRYTICNLHALLAEDLLPDRAAIGSLRSVPVGIGGTVYHPLGVPQQIEECFMGILYKAEAITDPFEQAFFAMVHLPYLQPFEDVNKRVSRLAANIPLVKRNLCPLSFVDVPQDDYVGALIGVYELQRIDYLRDVFMWAYRRSAARYAAVVKTLGDPDPFRLRLRTQIGECVRHVVTSRMDKGEATRWVQDTASQQFGEPDRALFIEAVETELICLHEGNIARFRLRPSEFAAWKPGFV